MRRREKPGAKVGKAAAAKEAARILAQKETMKAAAAKAAAAKAATPAGAAGHEATSPAPDAGEVETVRRLSFTLDEIERARLVPKVKF